MTAPRGNDSHACRSAVRRICLDSMLVSDTWNVMPIVKGQVGEVAIVRGAGLVEVDPPGLPGVVQARVSEGEHRMDEGPGHEDGHQRETCLQVLQVPAGMTGSDQHEPHSDQAGDRRAEQYHVRQVEAGILALSVALCRLRVEPPYGGPHPPAEDHRQGVPANQRCRPACACQGSGRAGDDRRGQGHEQFRPGCRHSRGGWIVRGFRLHGTSWQSIALNAGSARHPRLPACQAFPRLLFLHMGSGRPACHLSWRRLRSARHSPNHTGQVRRKLVSAAASCSGASSAMW